MARRGAAVETFEIATGSRSGEVSAKDDETILRLQSWSTSARPTQWYPLEPFSSRGFGARLAHPVGISEQDFGITVVRHLSK